MADEESSSQVKNILNTILEKGVDFEVIVLRKNWKHKLKLEPTSRKFTINKLTLGTLLEITKFTTGIEVLIPSDENFISIGSELMQKNIIPMVNIITLAVKNDSKKSNKKLIQFFLNNLTSEELLKIVILTLRQMDINSFLASIVSVKGMDMMKKKSPTEATTQTTGEPSEVS